MKPTPLLPTLLILLISPLALCANLTVRNNCAWPIHIAPDAINYSAPISTLAPLANAVFAFETQRFGNSVKFARGDAFDAPVSFDYTVSEGVTYYDVSDAAGAPFALWAVDRMESGASGCEPVGCPTLRCRAIRGCPADGRSFEVIACQG